MGRSSIAVVVVGAAVVGWAVAPVISMVRRGTVDQRTVRAWRDEIACLRQRGTAGPRDIPDQRGRPDSSEHHDPRDRHATGSPGRS